MPKRFTHMPTHTHKHTQHIYTHVCLPYTLAKPVKFSSHIFILKLPILFASFRLVSRRWCSLLAQCMEGAPKGAEGAKRSSSSSWSCSHLACRFARQQPLDSQLNTFVQQLEEIEPMLKLRLGTIMLILGGGGVRGYAVPAAPASSDRSGINGARPPHMAAVIFGQPWDGIWLRMATDCGNVCCVWCVLRKWLPDAIWIWYLTCAGGHQETSFKWNQKCTNT